MTTLAAGDACPDFELENQAGEIVKRSDFAGKKILIYFYPKASTPGCTTQSCAVRDAKDELAELNVERIGISPDAPAKQQRFDEKNELGFTLLCDTEKTVAEAFGVWGEKKMYGKTYMGIIRSSFLVDENGTIIEAWYKVKPNETVSKAIDALKS